MGAEITSKTRDVFEGTCTQLCTGRAKRLFLWISSGSHVIRVGNDAEVM
jgi:hypothetical protein